MVMDPIWAWACRSIFSWQARYPNLSSGPGRSILPSARPEALSPLTSISSELDVPGDAMQFPLADPTLWLDRSARLGFPVDIAHAQGFFRTKCCNRVLEFSRVDVTTWTYRTENYTNSGPDTGRWKSCKQRMHKTQKLGIESRHTPRLSPLTWEHMLRSRCPLAFPAVNTSNAAGVHFVCSPYGQSDWASDPMIRVLQMCHP